MSSPESLAMRIRRNRLIASRRRRLRKIAYRSRAAAVLVLLLVGCAPVQTAPDPEATVAGTRDLLEGAAVLFSTDGGESFSTQPPTIPPRGIARVAVKLTFDASLALSQALAASSASLALSLDAGAAVREMGLLLNGREIALPLEGMIYRTVPGIDPRGLQAGENTLIVDLTVRNGSRETDLMFAPAVTLTPHRNSELEFQAGPLLGAYGENFFSLTCRTNMRATVAVYRTEDAGIEDVRLPDDLEGTELVARTDLGLMHRVRVPHAPSATRSAYVVVAERDAFKVGRVINPRTPPDSGLKLLVLGDSRTNVDDWRMVATAAATAIEPNGADLMIHLGDMVTLGTRDWEWDEQFWRPGRGLLEKVPVYPVIGNHEADAPLYDVIFYGPADDGQARNWAQELGGVLLIGIDGGQDWLPDSPNALWLEETLSRSTARFTLLFSHYPGWSSAAHGRLDEEGHPRERPARETRETVFPMLSQYGAMAMVAGHDHTYERSELPDGLTAITCGGAGAPLYAKTADAARQNPYSEVYSAQHHYCLFDVGTETMTLRAISPTGELIDSRTWRAWDR